jgi:hypothetical protein
MQVSNLAVDTFMILRDAFFNPFGKSKPFELRDKRDTQDDPYDELISKILTSNLKNAICHKSSGPLITPDLAVYKPQELRNVIQSSLQDFSKIIAIEVKKLERSKNGRVARSTGLDYNSTPPCGIVRIYDKQGTPLDVRALYLFVCLERLGKNKFILTALCLCDGNLLNENFELYLNIINRRQKGIGLGSYGDGANRNRPMLIFSNPLGASQFDRKSTLITMENMLPDNRIGLVYNLHRKDITGILKSFFVYQKIQDIPGTWRVENLEDPIPRPAKRGIDTQSRGKFRLPIVVKSE